MAQNLKQKPLKKAFSPKMLVYENLKNENVLKHFKNRFAQLDTLLNHPIWVKSPVINLGLNSQHTADIRNTDSLYWAKTAHEQLAIARHNGLEVTGQVYARPDAYFDADNDDAEQVSKYKAKTQAELGWNIINSKFYQGKEKKAKVALANELSRLQSKKRMTADIYEKAAEELTEQYNFYIGTIIAHRLDNLDIMNEASIHAGERPNQQRQDAEGDERETGSRIRYLHPLLQPRHLQQAHLPNEANPDSGRYNSSLAPHRRGKHRRKNRDGKRTDCRQRQQVG